MSEKTDHRLLYAALGALTLSLGGAIAGYMYADNQQKLRALDPSTPSTMWDSKVFNMLVGAIFAPLSGALFGYNIGNQEMKIAEIEQRNAVARALNQTRGMGQGLEQSVAQGKAPNQWQDYVTSRTSQNLEATR